MADSRGFNARRTALAGVFSAGALAMLWIACLVPSGRVGITAVAGLFPVFSVLAAGRRVGYLTWATTSVLGLLVLPRKELALLYALFLGLYPVVKNRLEQFTSRVWEWVCKLIYFNAAFMVFWVGFRTVFLSGLHPVLINRHALLYAVINLIFIIYDIGLSRLIALIQHRISIRRRNG